MNLVIADRGHPLERMQDLQGHRQPGRQALLPPRPPGRRRCPRQRDPPVAARAQARPAQEAPRCRRQEGRCCRQAVKAGGCFGDGEGDGDDGGTAPAEGKRAVSRRRRRWIISVVVLGRHLRARAEGRSSNTTADGGMIRGNGTGRTASNMELHLGTATAFDTFPRIKINPTQGGGLPSCLWVLRHHHETMTGANDKGPCLCV